jgi:hypothetical protein
MEEEVRNAECGVRNGKTEREGESQNRGFATRKPRVQMFGILRRAQDDRSAAATAQPGRAVSFLRNSTSEGNASTSSSRQAS